eukprot:SAG22_NODE_1383_length_4542_cov_2.418636_4_plen_66_part_00
MEVVVLERPAAGHLQCQQVSSSCKQTLGISIAVEWPTAATMITIITWSVKNASSSWFSVVWCGTW